MAETHDAITASATEKRKPTAEDVAKLWRMPAATTAGGDGSAHPIRVYNSLTRSKVQFVPMKGRQVLWYMCGPTVYDSAHMGHARTYISFDVLRRILSNYFNYDVMLTMNITDIDDKIIKRSNEEGIGFVELARRYEAEFLADMAKLGVLEPEVMTRVSEYVPEIIAYIQKIIDNGYAYESNGSVYFDVESFSASDKHTYAKLVPENAGNKEALAEGEGVLAKATHTDEKRNGCDFALWKRSKPGEPWWDSPWGQGRPGWHIECSTMCTETLGAFADGPIDIHSGGIDLRFPHHDNEIAQSEAYLDHHQWVNYFLHTGHLNIDGQKMSKSIKNFIKISSALERYGARRLRLMFLSYKYNEPMDYSDAVMENVSSIDKIFMDFFLNVKAKLRVLTVDGPAKWGPAEKHLANRLDATKDAVRAALCDDFDTPKVLLLLRELVSDINRYIADDKGKHIPQILRAAADYISYIFRIFGLIDPLPSIGYSVGGDAASGTTLEETLGPYLDTLASFRENVRDAARAKDTGKVLAACDHLRDEVLPLLGVQLEDVSAKGGAGDDSGPKATWKLRDPAEMRREKEEKEAALAEKARLKQEAAERARKKEEEKRALASIPPADYFKKQYPGKYGSYDEKGIPLTDAAGAALTDKAKGKLATELEKHVKLHEWFLTLDTAKETSVNP